MSVTEEVFHRLLDRLGHQGWWPGESPWEVMIGAVLVQNTAWKNVERALENLRTAQLLDPHQLAATDSAELAELIRPAGYYRRKAARLLNLMRFVVDQYDGSLAALQRADLLSLREQLLGVNGIGPETADSILLYALNQPVMVVDTYTHRIFARHGWVEYDTDYHALQEHLASELPSDAAVFNELHTLLVHVGHHHCKPKPKCEDCPLCDLLPAAGIVEPI